jgi:hypothetical protein
MSTHVKVLGVLFIVFGVLGVFAAFFSSFVFGILATIVGASHERGAPLGVAVLGLAGVAMTIVLLVLSVPGIICGIGLLRFRRWARILGIILAAIGLLRFPVGTIFGVYALVILFRKDTEALFEPPVSAPAH